MSYLLPETLGETLEVAMDELERLEPRDDIKIRIDDCWYERMSGYTMCCLGGIFFVEKLLPGEDYRDEPSGKLFPAHCFDPRNRQRMLALDWVGYGAIQAAIDDFYGGSCGSPKTLKLKTETREEWFIPTKELVVAYGDKPTTWKQEMRQIASQLKVAEI